jgi:hypothetical protein
VPCAWSIHLEPIHLRLLFIPAWAFGQRKSIFVFPPAQLSPKALLFSPPDFICRSARSVSSLVASSSLCLECSLDPARFFDSQLISRSAQRSSVLLQCCLLFGPAPLDSAAISARIGRCDFCWCCDTDF